MKKIALFLFSLLLFPISVFAIDITEDCTILINDKANTKITDNNENTFITINKNELIKIQSDKEIHGIYIIYERKNSEGIIKNSNRSASIGTNGFLHEYLDIEKLIGTTNELTIEYNENVKIAEIYILDEGELPEFVEIWNLPYEEADLLLFSTHSDDEQLFFAGLLPTYVAKGKKVQVIYFTNHYDNTKRLHEQLHGLYTVGVTAYPIVGDIPDAYSTSLEGALKNLKNVGITEEDALEFEVEMLRRFKPLVVVGHDEAGEYSHGQHILNTYILKHAIEKAGDSTYHETSFFKYGVWDTPKTYLHLYKENPIIMDYDSPLDYFNGRTAYEVSKEGYKKHISQAYTWFTAWLNGKNNEYTKATQIKKYSPLEFGLFRSLVGEDILKNDMFENIVDRKEETIHEENENKEQEENKENKNNQINKIEKKKNNKNNKILYFVISGALLIIGCTILWIRKKIRRNQK